MAKVKIKDLAVFAVPHGHDNPVGEAPGRNEKNLNLTSLERTQMLDRLYEGVSTLFEEAHTTHLALYKVPYSEEIDLDYITRLSTHEFFFYTQVPLTLSEFASLQNKIAEKAKNYPAGIQLILGSFAVKTDTNRVMNVTPHITSGPFPQFNFIVKNTTSPIDVHYKEEDSNGKWRTLKMFDKSMDESFLPSIKINEIRYPFQFAPVIKCKTPSGTPFLTAVEICLDHLSGFARSAVDLLARNKSKLLSQPFSHVVVSNTVVLQKHYCIGDVIHIDPKYSVRSPKVQDVKYTKNNPFVFSKNDIALLDLGQTIYPTLQEIIDIETLNQLCNKLEDLKFGADDELMNEFIREQKLLFATMATDEDRTTFISALKQKIQLFESDTAIAEIRFIIADFRDKSGLLTIGMTAKANALEKLMSTVSLEDRLHFLETKSAKNVLHTLATHRYPQKAHLKENGAIDFDKASRHFKEFKNKFFDEIKPHHTEALEIKSPKGSDTFN